MASTKYIDATHALVLAEDSPLIVLPADPLSVPVGYVYTVVDNYGIAATDTIDIAAEFEGDLIAQIGSAYGVAILQWTGLRYVSNAQGGTPQPTPATATIVDLNMLSTYALPNGTAAGQMVWVFDNLGQAGISPQTVTGNLNVGNSVSFSEPGQAILFIWAGSVWNVPSWLGLLNG